MSFNFFTRQRWLIALLAGVSSLLAFSPLDCFPIAFVSQGVLAVLLQSAPTRRAGFQLGFFWGLGSYFAGLSWLYVILTVTAGMSPPVAVFALLVFCSLLALYTALAGFFTVWLRRGGILYQAFVFAALWVLIEWLRGTVFTGFPWLAIGYTQTPPSPLAGFFPVLGVYGVGGIVAFVSALAGSLAMLLITTRNSGRSVQRRSSVTALVFIVLTLATGFGLRHVKWTAPIGTPVAFSLLQPNVPAGIKWNEYSFNDILRTAEEMVAAANGKIIVLPETALPDEPDNLRFEHPDYIRLLERHLARNEATLITGVFLRNAEREGLNSAVTLGIDGGQAYSKNPLVPFGEYPPPLFGWFANMLNIPMSDHIAPGGARQPLLRVQGVNIAVNICYEDVFGAELIYSYPDADLTLNLANLDWYGHSFAPPQHLQIGRVRAMESGRPMLSAANSGVTALVQPDGTTAPGDVLDAFKMGILEVKVQPYRGLTPFARWGDYAALLVAVLTLLITGIFGAIQRRRRPTRPETA